MSRYMRISMTITTVGVGWFPSWMLQASHLGGNHHCMVVNDPRLHHVEYGGEGPHFEDASREDLSCYTIFSTWSTYTSCSERLRISF